MHFSSYLGSMNEKVQHAMVAMNALRTAEQLPPVMNISPDILTPPGAALENRSVFVVVCVVCLAISFPLDYL